MKPKMLRQYVITDDVHGYLKTYPLAAGAFLILDQFCTTDLVAALRFPSREAADRARRAHQLRLPTWRTVPIQIDWRYEL